MPIAGAGGYHETIGREAFVSGFSRGWTLRLWSGAVVLR